MKLDSAVFYTNDLDRIIEFYRDILKFKVDYIQEGRFASFDLGNAKLGIKQTKEERETPGHQTVFIAVDDIQKVYDEIKSKGLEILKELVEENWGTNFSILDPDENKVQFVEKKN